MPRFPSNDTTCTCNDLFVDQSLLGQPAIHPKPPTPEVIKKSFKELYAFPQTSEIITAETKKTLLSEKWRSVGALEAKRIIS